MQAVANSSWADAEMLCCCAVRLCCTQMAGRAGRRGLDAVGMVVIAAWEEPPGDHCAAMLMQNMSLDVVLWQANNNRWLQLPALPGNECC
jgi:hypothetical protein